jgi:hypothetical protein
VPEKQRQQHLLSRLLVIELSLAHAGASSPPQPSPAAPPAAVARHRTPFSAGRRARRRCHTVGHVLHQLVADGGGNLGGDLGPRLASVR